MEPLPQAIFKTFLFRGLSPEALQQLLQQARAEVRAFGLREPVFTQGSTPAFLYVLLSGAVQVERVDPTGKRTLVNRFEEPGTVFGEVYLYLDGHSYDYDCISAAADTKALLLPKALFDMQSPTPQAALLTRNMLTILSEKAFYLNKKLLIASSYTLRQKIATYLLQNADAAGLVRLAMNREELAEYLGTARPSLSRELMSMEQDGLVEVDKGRVQLKDKQALQDLL